MTALTHPNGSYNRAAIKAAVAAIISGKREFVESYAGAARAFWAERVREDAVTRVLDLASTERAQFIADRIKITYTAAEAAKLASLDAAAQGCPISFTGNADARDYRSEAGIIREAAHARAADKVIKQITRAARLVSRRAA